MANNRIYLHCNGCGAELFLGKHFISPFYYAKHDDSTLEDRLNKFYEEHAWCNGQGLECFSITYEFPEGG